MRTQVTVGASAGVLLLIVLAALVGAAFAFVMRLRDELATLHVAAAGATSGVVAGVSAMDRTMGVVYPVTVAAVAVAGVVVLAAAAATAVAASRGGRSRRASSGVDSNDAVDGGSRRSRLGDDSPRAGNGPKATHNPLKSVQSGNWTDVQVSDEDDEDDEDDGRGSGDVDSVRSGLSIHEASGSEASECGDNNRRTSSLKAHSRKRSSRHTTLSPMIPVAVGTTPPPSKRANQRKSAFEQALKTTDTSWTTRTDQCSSIVVAFRIHTTTADTVNLELREFQEAVTQAVDVCAAFTAPRRGMACFVHSRSARHAVVVLRREPSATYIARPQLTEFISELSRLADLQEADDGPSPTPRSIAFHCGVLSTLAGSKDHVLFGACLDEVGQLSYLAPMVQADIVASETFANEFDLNNMDSANFGPCCVARPIDFVAIDGASHMLAFEIVVDIVVDLDGLQLMADMHRSFTAFVNAIKKCNTDVAAKLGHALAKTHPGSAKHVVRLKNACQQGPWHRPFRHSGWLTFVEASMYGGDAPFSSQYGVPDDLMPIGANLGASSLSNSRHGLDGNFESATNVRSPSLSSRSPTSVSPESGWSGVDRGQSHSSRSQSVASTTYSASGRVMSASRTSRVRAMSSMSIVEETLKRRNTAAHGEMLYEKLCSALFQERMGIAVNGASNAQKEAVTKNTVADAMDDDSFNNEWDDLELEDDDGHAHTARPGGGAHDDMFDEFEREDGIGPVPSDLEDDWGGKWHRSEMLLGRGASGAVHLAMSAATGALVAMKSVPLKDFADRDGARAFGREVTMLTKLKHVNVVEYRSFIVTQEHAVIVMEYVSGGTIASIIENFGSLSEEVTAKYLRDVVRGLQYLHASSVIHRDIKPHNVLVSLDGACKISDFGTVSLDGDDRKENVLQGSPLFMAPEQARGHPEAKSDIWGLGLVALQMITAELPYTEEVRSMPPMSFIWMLGSDDSFVPQLPDDIEDANLRDLMLQCFSRSAADRPSAEDLLRHKLFEEIGRKELAAKKVKDSLDASRTSSSQKSTPQRTPLMPKTPSVKTPLDKR
jgi:hypothetical protein